MGIDTFSVEQINSIAYLAFQCPLRGGKAVYWARALYAMIQDTTYDDTQMCVDDGYEMYKKDKDTNSIIGENESFNVLLYPNPATNKVVLVASCHAKCLATFSMMDATGREVQSSTVMLSKDGFEVSINNVAKGLYIVKVSTVDAKVIFQTKLSVIK